MTFPCVGGSEHRPEGGHLGAGHHVCVFPARDDGAVPQYPDLQHLRPDQGQTSCSGQIRVLHNQWAVLCCVDMGGATGL